MWWSDSQDRVAAVAQAVADHPLDLADPDGHAGELGGVGVELDAEDRLGADLRDLHRALEHEEPHLMASNSRSLSAHRRDDQEVAGAAGGVEHADAAESIEEVLEDGVRVLLARRRLRDLAAGQDQLRDARLHLRVLAPERAQDDGLDEAPDGVAVGVVGAELGALVRVQAALEQGAEDRGLDERPVELADLQERRDLCAGQAAGRRPSRTGRR